LLLAEPKLWAKAHFVGTRFGHDTSNVVKSVNKTLMLDQELLILQLLDSLWNRVMDLRFHRLKLATSAHTSEKWTPWARAKLQEHCLLACTNSVVMRSNTQGIVKQLNSNVYPVDLEEGTCSCLVYQENGIPCGHAITAIFAVQGQDITPYMPDILTIKTWKKTYTSNFPLVNITNLQKLPLSECHPPLTRVPCG